MCTIYTHAVAGLGLGKLCFARTLPWSFWLLAGFLPIVPDFDVFTHHAYGSILGHRGYTHSLAFALLICLVVAGLTYRYFQIRFLLLWGFFFLATASHGILDAFTNGGFGIPLLWPLISTRFGPWGPMQVPDIGFEWPDPRVSRSVRTEMLWVWLPTAVLVVLVMGYRRWRAAATVK
jgi:inner membrane protein